jgi:hypothetical protein
MSFDRIHPFDSISLQQSILTSTMASKRRRGSGNGDADDRATSNQRSPCIGEPSFLRRSIRDPAMFLLEKREINALLDKIRNNHEDTVVLKIKDHILADINSAVMDAIIDALFKNKVCQALYIQNLDKSITDVQMLRLISLFTKKMIWCLNIGENYEISNCMWQKFCDALPNTNITHMYASEHVISIDLKNKMRDHIRENRKKHKKHCSMKNLEVIERCTHCWWNPINGVKELKPPPPTPPSPSPPPSPVKVEFVPRALTEKDVAYWQEGRGEGGDKPWKFKCVCGETCSSYENYRYHPVGRMFECSACTLWSHVNCVFGPKFSDDDLDKLPKVLCRQCTSNAARARRHGEESK